MSDEPREHITARVPADVARAIRKHQERLRETARVEVSFSEALASLLRLGAERAASELAAP